MKLAYPFRSLIKFSGISLARLRDIAANYFENNLPAKNVFGHVINHNIT